MRTARRVLAGRYVDSVVLMRLAKSLTGLPGVEDAAALMGTPANRELLAEAGFAEPGWDGAGPNDLVVAVKARDEDAAAGALARVEELLRAPEDTGLATVRTLDDALAVEPSIAVAAISVPGEHAAAEARRALERGLHVFCFSSDVSLDDELALKRLARDRGLLCMGPDCGTAIVSGVGLGFANAVRRGRVGVVGSAGTGLQAMTCLLDRYGAGVSHAIGCGTRDVSDEVGGLTMFAGLAALLSDPQTDSIVVVAKPPGPATAARIRAAAASASKPVVCCFLGEMTLDEAATLAGAEVPGAAVAPGRAGRGRFVRGLYSGGSLAYEAQLVLQDAGLDVASNAPAPGARLLADARRSDGHTVVDLGTDEFTRGRPHPMIDLRERHARLLAEAADPAVAAILLDVVLGYGAAADPAGELADPIRVAVAAGIPVLASVVGTERDPQGLDPQEARLRAAGATVFPTNAAAARAAAVLLAVTVP